MSYFFSKKIHDKDFDTVLGLVGKELEKEGFGIISDIDVQATLKNKLNTDFRKYKILGACNPSFAHKVLQKEDKIGLFLPCNVVVQEHDGGVIEISTIDPVASMSAVDMPELATIALEVQQKLQNVINNL